MAESKTNRDRLVTGQNPASAIGVGEKMVQLMQKRPLIAVTI